MSQSKLNQIVALNSPRKSDFQKLISKYYHIVQKQEPFFGIERVYNPKDDDGEKLPPESSKVQINIDDLMDELGENWQNMFDVVFTNDCGNCQAFADIVVDDTLILSSVPITTLLFLEKQLTDWKTIIEKLPNLPISETWTIDENTGLRISTVVQSNRTKKVPKVIVKYPATPEHPAQTELIYEDIIVGTWSTKKLSSAIPAVKKEECLERISKLKEAVVLAREQANSTLVEQKKGGYQIMSFLFG